MRDVKFPRRSGWMSGAALTCLLLPLAAACGQERRGPVEVRDLRELEQAFTQLAARVGPSAVAIRTYLLGPYVDRQAGRSEEGRIRWLRSFGTGAVIRRDGLVLTNAHVIEDADVVLVTTHDGQEYEAELVQADQRKDLAVLKIDAPGLRPVIFGDADRLRRGQWCFVVGNPFGLASGDGQSAVSYGIVNAIGRDLSDQLNPEGLDAADTRYYGDLIQTGAAINPGNSGGPLFNLNGEMIGVVTAIESRSGVHEGAGFAIPIDRWTRQIVDQLSRGEEVRHGYLGVQIGAVNPATRRAAGLRRPRGVEISRLDPPNGPAAQANLERGDIILEFDGSPINGTEQLVRVVGATPVGKTARLTYLRDGKRQTTEVTLGARPVSPVRVGQHRRPAEPKTCHWRGAWLAEPSEETLAEFGLTREQAGLVVRDVDPASSAERAGLEPRQVILRLNRRRVRTIDEFLAAAEDAGPPVRLEVRTDGETQIIRMPPPPE